MTNLTARMESLRNEMEEKYLRGEKEDALEISCRLDKLIALAQREELTGGEIENLFCGKGEITRRP